MAAVVPVSATTFSRQLLGRADLIFTAGLFGTIMLLVLPVPFVVMDMLLALSIASSLLIMLVVIYVRQPVEFFGVSDRVVGPDAFPLGSEHLFDAPGADAG